VSIHSLEAEAAKFVNRPCPKRRVGDIADVVHIEAQQRTDLRLLQLGFGSRAIVASYLRTSRKQTLYYSTAHQA